MKVTAIFEEWLIADGDYPPLRRRQIVRLSFEVQGRHFKKVSRGESERFENLRAAECRFVGVVLAVFREGIDRDAPLMAVESNGFRFYVHQYSLDGSVRRGSKIAGEGELYVDGFPWVEFVDLRRRPPELLRTFRVVAIRTVQIPERFISRPAHGSASWPTAVPAGEYGPRDVREIETMEGQRRKAAFYLLELDDAGLARESVPRTFIG